MQLGMIGLGKMGANMTTRLIQGGHTLVVYDRNPAAVQAAAAGGAIASTTLAELVSQLAAPRAVWLMVPAGDPTEQTIHQLATILSADDTILDGGNSNYKDSQRRAELLKHRASTS